MKIETLELSKEEMNEAVQRFLDWRNVKVKVSGVTSVGYPLRAWQVELETEKSEELKIPQYSTPEQLGAAIEKGEL